MTESEIALAFVVLGASYGKLTKKFLRLKLYSFQFSRCTVKIGRKVYLPTK